jgi:membrane-bound acyltransferase YfiQ involved in biofilm formation
MLKLNVLTLNPSKNGFAQTYISTNHISNNLGIYISVVFLTFLFYIMFKVRKSIKDDKKI